MLPLWTSLSLPAPCWSYNKILVNFWVLSLQPVTDFSTWLRSKIFRCPAVLYSHSELCLYCDKLKINVALALASVGVIAFILNHLMWEQKQWVQDNYKLGFKVAFHLTADGTPALALSNILFFKNKTGTFIKWYCCSSC